MIERIIEGSARNRFLIFLMKVEANKAAGKHEHKGQTYYFCSAHCLTKFKEDPEKFLKSPAAQNAVPAEKATGASYVCPMDPEVRESKPGAWCRGTPQSRRDSSLSLEMLSAGYLNRQLI